MKSEHLRALQYSYKEKPDGSCASEDTGHKEKHQVQTPLSKFMTVESKFVAFKEGAAAGPTVAGCVYLSGQPLDAFPPKLNGGTHLPSACQTRPGLCSRSR